jgi:Tol biopolymer transport system component
MRRSSPAIRVLGRAAALALTSSAMIAAAPAEGAYPGNPGSIVYPKFSNSGVVELTGGLLAHGPRRSDAPTQLTDSARDEDPSFSANGRLIVFDGNRDPGENRRGTHIYVMKSDGSDIRQLTSGGFYDSNPSFSPDGREIVFDRGPLEGHATHIFSVNVDGSGLRQLTDDSGIDSDPTFTPNGRLIVFVSNRRSRGRRDRTNIFSMRPDGSHIRLLIGGPREEYEPDVSPNGRSIAFASTRDHGHGPNIFVARLNGSHMRELTHSRHDCFSSACYSHPSWSPDGKHLVYLSAGRYSTAIEVARADGRGFSKDFDEGSVEEEGEGDFVGPPAWGPRPR